MGNQSHLSLAPTDSIAVATIATHPTTAHQRHWPDNIKSWFLNQKSNSSWSLVTFAHPQAPDQALWQWRTAKGFPSRARSPCSRAGSDGTWSSRRRTRWRTSSSSPCSSSCSTSWRGSLASVGCCGRYPPVSKVVSDEQQTKWSNINVSKRKNGFHCNRFTLNAIGNECLLSLWSLGLNNFLVDRVLTESLCLNIMRVSCLHCFCCLLSCLTWCCCSDFSSLKFCCCCNSLTSSRTLLHPFTITKSTQVFSGFAQSTVKA